jgi:hypothetical protein
VVVFKYFLFKKVYFFSKIFLHSKNKLQHLCRYGVLIFQKWVDPIIDFFFNTKNLEVVGRGDGTMVDWLDRVTHCVHGFGSKVE